MKNMITIIGSALFAASLAACGASEAPVVVAEPLPVEEVAVEEVTEEVAVEEVTEEVAVEEVTEEVAVEEVTPE